MITHPKRLGAYKVAAHLVLAHKESSITMTSRMMVTVFVLLVIYFTAAPSEAGFWKRISTTTSTKYIVPTTLTETITVASTCYSAVNVTASCRKKREFDIDQILPSPPSR